ncbi:MULTISPECIES: GntR family transcriptional regulator [unclassified Mycolicibacterium]|uniref:GntR family transcriptional regulator n=1 Tax=unclassified Mycolicibacterium TaxID=2636767 RepID=UPI001F4C3A09|nr:GntR family transcriptional regulator [Mycolicibacterium sp. YH-1]UNB52199.1 GntR family transcriptional regulator [Mycolicibacterium sp. YH-1]
MTISHRSLRETVADALRDMIITGQLAPGTRLAEGALAEQLGVSRVPVREAIRALEPTGLVQIVPRHGAHVATVNSDDIEAIQEIRRVLEGWIVGAAAERHTAEDMPTIDRYLADGTKAAKAGDTVAASRAHNGFHRAIEAATGNPHAAVAMEPLRQRTELVFSMIGATDSGLQQWEEHRAIRDAIADRDADRARTLIDQHITQAMARYRDALQAAPQGRSTVSIQK